eukprot:s1267_g40.t1
MFSKNTTLALSGKTHPETQRTCMSQHSEDPDTVDLTVDFAGLTISVRGSPSSSAAFVRGLSHHPLASSPARPSSAGPRPSSAYQASPARSQVGSTTSVDTRASIQDSFGPLPETWANLATAHLGVPAADARARAERAWRAGCWAKAVLEGRVSSPNRTPTVPQQNRAWCVLRSARLDSPQDLLLCGRPGVPSMIAPGKNNVGESDLFQEFKVYALEYPAGDDPSDGEAVAVCLIVLRRMSGLLLALPQGYFTPEHLAAGLTASAGDMMGQSASFSLPAGEVQSLEASVPPVPVQGTNVDVLLVDFNIEVSNLLQRFQEAVYPLELVHTFDSSNPLMLPRIEPLVAAAWQWVQDPGSGERAAFYSAQEDEVDDVPETPPAPARAKAKARAGTGEGGPAPDKKPRATVASLAAQLEQLTVTLPALVQQVESLNQRTATVETHLSSGSVRGSALQQPLGSLTSSGFAPPSVAALAKEIPPPRNIGKSPQKVPHAGGLGPHQVSELEAEKMETYEPPMHLTQAIMEQSKALSTLVSQIAGEPLGDFASSSTGFSSRGATGRQKLQQELALHRGTFYQAVMSSMARRMQPSRPSEAPPAELLNRGITATAYVERFGGYGRCRDIGQIAWMTAMVMDHLQSDNIGAVKDAVALLLVCLEQTSLDNGRMDIGLLLALQEDPPAALFTNRSLATYSRGKAFAPLADQKWVANALTYLKELDTIATKRIDATSKTNDRQEKDPAESKRAPKKKPQPKWKQKGNSNEEGD